MKTLCFYSRDLKPTGIRVIFENIQKKFPSVDIPMIDNIDEAMNYDIILPYGLLEPIDVMKRDKSKCQLSLMVDAISLIDLSQYHYFKGKKILSFKDRNIDYLRYIQDRFLEKLVFNRYKRVMLVSYSDKSYFDRIIGKNASNKIMVIQNGVNLPSVSKAERIKDGKIILGFLSSWNSGIVGREKRCFLEYVWKNVVKMNPNIELRICGRGMNQFQKDYFGKYENIKCIGEVKDLKEYFDQIDINLMIMPKHAGILNKMLDGFAYKCPTIGEPHNFWAFKDIPDCFYTYTDAESLIKAIDEIISKPEEASMKVDLLYNYVKEYHNWDENYNSLKNYILELLRD
ncbi:glycosyltransferase [Bacteroides bouchesdurhonensis]|uniref:glycosyltransferase n=1 Tax=Bacteroides bouchesdurhonensis TaxID=1841855 RepID=UPI00097F789F|nr:glycosyltransferase [Bacteroides bouchesdurhonensis]